jgi:hypothetical protein
MERFSIEKAILLARLREEMRRIANSGKNQLHELTRQRIERNRAAKHARSAIIRMR